MKQTQQIPDIENKSLLAKVYTSKSWSAKLSDQQMNYQFIQSNLTQSQINLIQNEVILPNSYLVSCESSYYTFGMLLDLVIPSSVVNTGSGCIYQKDFRLWVSPGTDIQNINEDIAVPIMNLPYNSACFIDQTIATHENTGKNQQYQQYNRQIYRQQYDPTITEEYINNHWYEYYGNTKPQILKAFASLPPGNKMTFLFQVMIPLKKLFYLFQQDFLPLFKLANQLKLQFVPNTQFINNYMLTNVQEVITNVSYENIGCYLLQSTDTLLEKDIRDEINKQNIQLCQTQTWIESFDCNTNKIQQNLINVGFDCLTYIDLGLYAAANQDFYSGFSTLQDLRTNDQTVPKATQHYDYSKNLSFYYPQIMLNGKALMVGEQYLNNPILFMSINNRGLMEGQSNIYTKDFEYFNKLRIRYEQFTDKYVSNVEPDEFNYSGTSIKKQNNNYIITKLANYQSQPYSEIVEYTGAIEANSSSQYFLEVVYKYKQIVTITQSGDLSIMLQEYMM